jgi:uncharacterized protein YegP (UPF0339 family)
MPKRVRVRSGKLEIFRSKANANWFWRVRSSNGRSVAVGGEGYKRHGSAVRGFYAALHNMQIAAERRAAEDIQHDAINDLMTGRSGK